MTGSAPRSVVLDTSVVVQPPSAGVGTFADLVCVSAVTVAELHYGVGATTDLVEQAHRARRLQAILATHDVLPVDAGVAESYGLLANLVRQAGRDPRPGRLALLIAATAVRHGFALATRNPGDFHHLGRVLSVIVVEH